MRSITEIAAFIQSLLLGAVYLNNIAKRRTMFIDSHDAGKFVSLIGLRIPDVRLRAASASTRIRV